MIDRWTSSEHGGVSAGAGSRTEGSKFRDKKLSLLVPGRKTSNADGLNLGQGLVSWYCEQVQLYGGQETWKNF